MSEKDYLTTSKYSYSCDLVVAGFAACETCELSKAGTVSIKGN